jgi:hypothetical protein
MTRKAVGISRRTWERRLVQRGWVRHGEGFMKPIGGDPLGQMLANGLIDEAQFRAGRRWQANYQRMESCDGADRQAAVREFRRMNAAVSCIGPAVFRDVLGVGLSIRDVAKKHGDNYSRGRQGWQQIFGICIRRLAEASAAA